ncbi:hypothetical protein CMI40_00690 [Candidatus Pacearchaeota archaeon]|jgi:hypothetical protein|nr:hypothetical protein [Candidatus Pacearchaeota archaeon]|tara:strand:- start:8477 stop:8779 length:303 start_codon:yes stop_codon:yes gene_type:complete
MAIGVAMLVISVLVIAIWVIIEIKRLKHKLFAILLIGLILFAYLGTFIVFKGQNVDYKTVPGLIDATKTYFSWLGSIFGNLKTITSNAIKMNWKNNKSIT